jgi:hypothetical protein
MSMLLADPRLAVEYMVLSVRRGNQRTFVLILSEYLIEGTRYETFMFTVSPRHVTDITATAIGFRGKAIFPAEALNSQDREKGLELADGAFSVTLEVDRSKITSIQLERVPGTGAFEPLFQSLGA